MRSVKATAKATRSRAQTGRRAASPVARVTAVKQRGRRDEPERLWLRILKAPLKLIAFRRPILVATAILAAITVTVAIIVSGVIGRSVANGERTLGVLAADAGFGISQVHLSGNPAHLAANCAGHAWLPARPVDLRCRRPCRPRPPTRRLIGSQSAEVRRRYPDAITVSILEKRPFALVAAIPTGKICRDRTFRCTSSPTRTHDEFLKLPHLIGAGAPEVSAELIDAATRPPRRRLRVVKGMQRVGERRWNLILDDGVIVELPEKGWQKELDALEHLIVDKGILERDVTEIDLRSPTTYFFLLRNGDKQQVERGKAT